MQEKISEFTNLPKESYVDIVETEKTEIKDIITSLTNDKPENTEIINNLSALIDEDDCLNKVLSSSNCAVCFT